MSAAGGQTAPNRLVARTLAFSASTSRFFGGVLVTRLSTRVRVVTAISSIANRKASALAFDGSLAPLTFLTYWRAAASTSLSVAGGSKLWRVLMFRQMGASSHARG